MYDSAPKDEILRFVFGLLSRDLGAAHLNPSDLRCLTLGGQGKDIRFLASKGVPEEGIFVVERERARSLQLERELPHARHYRGDLGQFRRVFEQMCGDEAGINLFNCDLDGTVEASIAGLRGVLPLLKRGRGPRFLFLVTTDARRNRALEDIPGVARRALMRFGADQDGRRAIERFWALLWARHRRAPPATERRDPADPFKVSLRELSAFTHIVSALQTAELAISEAYRWTYASGPGARMRAFLFVLADETDPARLASCSLAAMDRAQTWLVRGHEAIEEPVPEAPEALPTLHDLATRKDVHAMIDKVRPPTAVPTASTGPAVSAPIQEKIVRIRRVLSDHNDATRATFEEIVAHVRTDPPTDLALMRRTIVNALWDEFFGGDFPGVLPGETTAPVPPAPVSVVAPGPPMPEPPVAPPGKSRPTSPVTRSRYRAKTDRAELPANHLLRLRLIKAERLGQLEDVVRAIVKEWRSPEPCGPDFEPTLAERQRCGGLLARGTGGHKASFLVSFLTTAADEAHFVVRQDLLADAYGEPVADLLAIARAHPTWTNPTFKAASRP